MPYNRALHNFALFTAIATFVLIVAGALVTSNDAGLAVPDWPTSFGSLYRIPPMEGGIQFEHVHRLLAEFVGFLTVILAFWTWRSDPRSWMRKLGFTALLTVAIQVILGGVTVLKFLPPAASVAHATLGQTFFCIAVAIALFTTRDWLDEEPLPALERQSPPLPALAWITVAAVFVQLLLGSMLRHHTMKLLPHLVAAAIVTVLVFWTAMQTLTQRSAINRLRYPAIVLLAFLLVQLGLGFTAYLTRVAWGSSSGAPTAAMVASTVAHVSVGGLLLAAALLLAIQVTRHAAAPASEYSSGNQKAATA